MKKKMLSSLTLNRETIRRLDAPALRWAAGAAEDSGPHCPVSFPRPETAPTGGTGPKQA